MDQGFVVGIIMTAVTLVMFFAWVAKLTDDSWRDQIVAHGCAEYYLDENHDRQWRWK